MSPTEIHRTELIKITMDIALSCPRRAISHTRKLAGMQPPPESEAIPAFFRNHPEETDILEMHGALKPLMA